MHTVKVKYHHTPKQIYPFLYVSLSLPLSLSLSQLNTNCQQFNSTLQPQLWNKCNNWFFHWARYQFIERRTLLWWRLPHPLNALFSIPFCTSRLPSAVLSSSCQSESRSTHSVATAAATVIFLPIRMVVSTFQTLLIDNQTEVMAMQGGEVWEGKGRVKDKGLETEDFCFGTKFD